MLRCNAKLAKKERQKKKEIFFLAWESHQGKAGTYPELLRASGFPSKACISQSVARIAQGVDPSIKRPLAPVLSARGDSYGQGFDRTWYQFYAVELRSSALLAALSSN